jgi:hypothetical protein
LIHIKVADYAGTIITAAADQARARPSAMACRPPLPSNQCEALPMWILMYVFSYSVSPAATNDRSEWRLLPTVVFQEFSNEERCRGAKAVLEGSLKEAGTKLKSGLEDLKTLGMSGPSQVIIAFNVECLPK